MKLKTLRNTLLIFSFMLLAAGLGYRAGTKNLFSKVVKKEFKFSDVSSLIKSNNVPANKQDLDFSEFWQVWQILESKYYDDNDIKADKMLQGAIKGMVSSLKDPWTVYLPPNDNKRAKEDLNGQFEGVGIQLGFKDDRLAVIAPLKGLPAEKAGVKAGDLIIHIKDEKKDIDVDTYDLSIYEAVEYIRGPKGQVVELTLLREGEVEPYVASIARGTIVVPSVELVVGTVENDKWEEGLVDSNKDMVAWLRVNRFGDNTLTEWNESVNEIYKLYENGKIEGMVLDLRNNPGGYLSGAVSLASEFVSKGVIVKQEDAEGVIENYSVNRKGSLLDISIVVLVNKGSASASEILAAALRYHRSAKIVGEKTFGKGTIQEAVELDGDSGLHVTTAKWLMPDGKWVNDNKGIDPDLEVDNPKDDDTIDLQLIKAVGELL